MELGLGEYGDRKKPVAMALPRHELVRVQAKYEYPEVKALFGVCYLGGLRIGEALKLKPEDCGFKNSEGRELLTLRVLTEKNRVSPMRTLPIMLEGPEKEMAEPFLSFQTTPGKPIFKLTRQNAHYHLTRQRVAVSALDMATRQIIDVPDYPLHPHYLRHCRLTHLVTDYNFDAMRLKMFAGWKDLKCADIYLRLGWQDLAKPFMEGDKQ